MKEITTITTMEELESNFKPVELKTDLADMVARTSEERRRNRKAANYSAKVEKIRKEEQLENWYSVQNFINKFFAFVSAIGFASLVVLLIVNMEGMTMVSGLIAAFFGAIGASRIYTLISEKDERALRSSLKRMKAE